MNNTDQVMIEVDELRALMVDAATKNASPNEERYSQLRRKLLSEQRLKPNVPRLVQSSQTLMAVRNLVQPKGGYAIRREFIQSEFAALDSFLQAELTNPMASATSDLLTNVDSKHVANACQKAIDRVQSDPDGAITSARTLLESVCKHILVEQRAVLSGKEDLPALYFNVIKGMGLAPDKSSEPAMRQVMQGCASIVQGVGELRSKIGDAHGQSPDALPAERRHAMLAVSIACAVSAFLIQTWEEQKPADTSSRTGF